MWKTIYFLFFMLGFMIAQALTPAKAAEQAIVFGGWSTHNDSTYTYKGETHAYNEDNYTLGYGRNNWFVAVSKLSYSNWGVVGYYEYVLWEWAHTAVSLRAGVVYGYRNTPNNVTLMPIVLPTLTQRIYDELYVQLSVIGNDEMVVGTANLLYKF